VLTLGCASLYPASRRAPTSSSLYPAEVGAASGSKRMATVNTGKFVLGAALSIITIGGCAPTFTVDGSRNPAEPAVRQVNNTSMDPALLRHQPKPDCAFRGPVSDPITAEETRQKLDYGLRAAMLPPSRNHRAGASGATAKLRSRDDQGRKGTVVQVPPGPEFRGCGASRTES
jgi:hypothetical protein